MPIGTTKFKCPECNKYSVARVVETKVGFSSVRRVRKCEYCGCKFITAERFIDFVKRRDA